jgi:hypothetical protein
MGGMCSLVVNTVIGMSLTLSLWNFVHYNLLVKIGSANISVKESNATDRNKRKQRRTLEVAGGLALI